MTSYCVGRISIAALEKLVPSRGTLLDRARLLSVLLAREALQVESKSPSPPQLLSSSREDGKTAPRMPQLVVCTTYQGNRNDRECGSVLFVVILKKMLLSRQSLRNFVAPSPQRYQA